MSIKEQDQNSTLLISLWAALSGAVVAGLAAVPMYFWSSVALYVVSLSFFSLEITALTAALFERGKKSEIVALIVSAIGILLAIAAVRTTAPQGLTTTFEIGFFVLFPCVTMAAMGGFAGIVAVARKMVG